MRVRARAMRMPLRSCKSIVGGNQKLFVLHCGRIDDDGP